MTSMYATLTSKGQITIPVAARKALGLHDGQKLAIRVEGNSLIVDAPVDLATVRSRIKQETQARGTWDRRPVSSDGWNARAEDFSADD